MIFLFSIPTLEPLFYDVIKYKLKNQIIYKIHAIISLLINIANNNLVYYSACFAIISLLLPKINDPYEIKDIIIKIIQKFKNIPNNELIMIWIDRLILPHKCLLEINIKNTLLQTSTYLTWIETQKGSPNTQEHNLWHIDWIINKQALVGCLINISKNEQIIQNNFYACEDRHTLIIGFHPNYLIFWDIIHGKNSQVIQNIINAIDGNYDLLEARITHIILNMNYNIDAFRYYIYNSNLTSGYNWRHIISLLDKIYKKNTEILAMLDKIFLHHKIRLCFFKNVNNKFITEASCIEKHEFHIFTNYN